MTRRPWEVPISYSHDTPWQRPLAPATAPEAGNPVFKIMPAILSGSAKCPYLLVDIESGGELPMSTIEGLELRRIRE